MEKILIIDDDPVVRHILSTILSELSFEVFEAGTSLEGLEILNRHASQSGVSFVFLDFMLDNTNSKPTLEQIRKEITPAPKICLISSHTEEEIGEQAEKITPDYFLQKPFRIDDVKKAIEAMKKQ